MTRDTAARVVGAVTLGWLGCFAYLTLSPQIPDLPGLSGDDRVLGTGHLVASSILAGLVHLWLVLARPGRGPVRTAVTAFSATAAFGLLVELVQFPVPEREPQLADAVLDLVGAAAAVALLARVPARVLRRPATTVAVGVVGAVLIAGTAAAGVWGTTTTPAERRCPGDVPDGEPASRPPPPGEPGAERVERGLVALYPLDGLPAEDATGTLPDLEPRGEVEQLDPHGVHLDGDAALETPGAAPEVAGRVDDAFTLEAWVRSGDPAQDGPARIVSSSDGTDLADVNVHLGQERHCLSIRIGVGDGDAEWLLVDRVFDRPRRAWHLVVTYERGTVRAYVDGRLRARARTGGDGLDWDPGRPLLVGDEATGDRGFRGDVYLVALYDRALTPAEVRRNLAAGPTT